MILYIYINKEMLAMKRHISMLLIAVMLGLFFCPALAENSGMELPASFDLRSVDTDGDGIGDRCYVTPVRAQYPFGTCWGFASTAAAEISILGSVLKDDPDAWKTLNLSEKQIAFFSHYYLDDPTSSQNGEGVYSIKDEGADDIYGGGSTFLATNTYAAGIGPTYESRDEALEYRGREGKIETVTRPDGVTYDQYAVDDDWMLDESYRYQQDFVLKEAYMLSRPTTFTYDVATKTTTYTYHEEATRAIKEQLMQLRGVTVGFFADVSRPWEGGEAVYMNVDTWAHYTETDKIANHAVTIVGWDDNYSRENFLADRMPPADGAWLVKNSWGSGENEFPAKGRGDWGIQVEKTDENGDPVLDENGDPVLVGSGYFWLSYYDRSISEPEAFIFDTALNAPQLGLLSNDRILRHQYDLMPVGTMRGTLMADEAKATNIFTADRNENLFYITYQITQPNTTAGWEVYMLAPDHKTPEDGILIASGETFHPYGGFYMEGIWPMLTLQEGQTYSIVLTEKTQDGSYVVNLQYGNGKNYPYLDRMTEINMGTPQYAYAVVNEGESMVYYHGEWVDWTNVFDCPDVLGGEMQRDAAMAMDTNFDNFAIKGLLIENSYDYQIGVAGEPEAVVLKVGGEPLTLDLILSVPGFEDRPLSFFAPRWELAGGDAGCAELTVLEDGAHATLTPVQSGSTWLFVHADGVGTAIIPVTIQ